MRIALCFFLSALLVVGCAYRPTASIDEISKESNSYSNSKILNEFTSLGFRTHETYRGVHVVVSDTYFEFDKSDLTLKARENLRAVSGVINDPRALSRSVVIEGHTDAMGDEKYNVELSQRRAVAVERELVFSNVSEGRISARGFGETSPVAPNEHSDGTDNPEGRSKNRRVEIIILNPE